MELELKGVVAQWGRASMELEVQGSRGLMEQKRRGIGK